MQNIRNKFVSALIIWALVAIGFIGLLTFTPDDQITASATTLYVGGSGPGNYTTIQAAIDAASPGDTIFVYAGTYYENIVIDKTLTLIGESAETTVIDGGGSKEVL